MASSITRIECGICLEEYNTTRRPRTLPCGHNFCGGCLQNCIEQGSNSCSICRKTHTATTVDDIPINTEFETVIQLTRSLIAGNNARSNESSDEDDDFTNGRCPKHKKSLLYFKCNSHGIDVCHQCTVIEHSPSKCNIIEIKEEVMKTKENTLADAQQRVDHLDSATTTLEKIIEEKKESNTKKQSQIECILKEIDEDNKICDLALKDIFENKNIKRQIQECIKSLKMSTKNKKIKKDTSELQVKIETLGILLEELKDKYDIEDCSKDLLKNSWSHITINSLKEMVTNSTEEVWASVNMRNQTYSAQISKRKGNLLIKSLSKRIPPENAVTIPYNKVKSLINRNNITVFLELIGHGTGFIQKMFGVLVHINLSSNEGRAQQFELMCTGEVDGISYANTTLLGIEGPICQGIWAGARNDGSQVALPGFTSGNRKRSAIIPGLVAGFYHSTPIRKPTHFVIYTEGTSQLVEDSAIGKVVDGLNHIIAAYSHAKIHGVKNIKIRECGIVLD